MNTLLPIRLVYVPCGTHEDARLWAKTVVQEKLAACANIVERINSIYIWQGEMMDDAEALLILKTSPARVDELLTRLRGLHSYKTPCFAVLQADVNLSYGQWVYDQTGTPHQG